MLCVSIYNLFILRSFPSIAGLYSLIQTQQQITRISKVDIDCVFVLLWPTLDNKLHDKSARQIRSLESVFKLSSSVYFRNNKNNNYAFHFCLLLYSPPPLPSLVNRSNRRRKYPS